MVNNGTPLMIFHYLSKTQQKFWGHNTVASETMSKWQTPTKLSSFGGHSDKYLTFWGAWCYCSESKLKPFSYELLQIQVCLNFEIGLPNYIFFSSIYFPLKRKSKMIS